MYVSSIGAINNSAFGIQQNNSSIMKLAQGAGSGSATDLAAVQRSEKTLQMENLQNKLTYLASSDMEESKKKLEKENIKRSFSTFA